MFYPFETTKIHGIFVSGVVVEPWISRFCYLFTLITKKFEKSTRNNQQQKNSKEKPTVRFPIRGEKREKTGKDIKEISLPLCVCVCLAVQC